LNGFSFDAEAEDFVEDEEALPGEESCGVLHAVYGNGELAADGV
jgi:hypothetical protein